MPRRRRGGRGSGYALGGPPGVPSVFVNVELTTAVAKGALIVPPDGVQQGPTGTFAYVVGTACQICPRSGALPQTLRFPARLSPTQRAPGPISAKPVAQSLSLGSLSVSQIPPIVSPIVSRIRPISASQTADECKPLRVAGESGLPLNLNPAAPGCPRRRSSLQQPTPKAAARRAQEPSAHRPQRSLPGRSCLRKPGCWRRTEQRCRR